MKHLTSVSCTVTLQLMLGPIYIVTHEDDLTPIPTGIATLISNTIFSGTFYLSAYMHVYNMATFQNAQLLGHRLQNLPLVELYGVFSESPNAVKNVRFQQNVHM